MRHEGPSALFHCHLRGGGTMKSRKNALVLLGLAGEGVTD